MLVNVHWDPLTIVPTKFDNTCLQGPPARRLLISLGDEEQVTGQLIATDPLANGVLEGSTLLLLQAAPGALQAHKQRSAPAHCARDGRLIPRQLRGYLHTPPRNFIPQKAPPQLGLSRVNVMPEQ